MQTFVVETFHKSPSFLIVTRTAHWTTASRFCCLYHMHGLMSVVSQCRKEAGDYSSDVTLEDVGLCSPMGNQPVWGLRWVSVCFTLPEKWVVLHGYNPYIWSVVEQWMNKWYSIFRDNDVITWLVAFESGNFCEGRGLHDAGILWCEERVCAKLCGNIAWRDAVKRSAVVLSTIYVYRYAYIHTLHYITAIHIRTYIHTYIHHTYIQRK